MTNLIKTPHAAVKIWNYVDRIHAEGANKDEINTVKEEIISTISCSQIQTMKSKDDPVGSFHFVLAPTRNWTAVITPGSWCVIMMANQPITKQDFETANPRLVKMVGKIESVRTAVTANPDGSRSTQFYVSGQDWGHIFNNTLYIDPLLSDGEERYDVGHSLFQHLIPIIKQEGAPLITKIRHNLETLLEVFGRPLAAEEALSTRLGKNTHNLKLPEKMKRFFNFEHIDIMKNIELVSGALDTEEGKYNENVNDGRGWINPFSLVGSHNLWQVLQDNANYALNEMFLDILWENGKAKFKLFNRIKPFAFRKEPLSEESLGIRSLFKNVPCHNIDDATVISVNAGTNWRDKFNFLEIKPDLSEFQIYDNWVKQKSQAWDKSGNDVFDREGFRPIIFSIKHLPFKDADKTGGITSAAPPVNEFGNPVEENFSIAEKQEKGYWDNKEFDLTLVAIANPNGPKTCWVAIDAAADTKAWFEAARADGLEWGINDSFRTMADQIAQLTAGRKAAQPGKSKHQAGCALDIQAYYNGAPVLSSTPEGQLVLDRLATFGEQYGWVRDVKDEPWHFTYKKWEPDIAQASAMPAYTAPLVKAPDGSTYEVDIASLTKWTTLLQEWYFDTHRLLNGQLIMTGSDEYISVGNNIKFNADLLSVKPNINKAQNERGSGYILAHVESVRHNFQVNSEGARTFQTTIEFVRGIVVDEQKNLIGSGFLDVLISDKDGLSKEATINDKNVISRGSIDNPELGQ